MKTISPEALHVINTLKIEPHKKTGSTIAYITAGNLTRPLYGEVNKVLEAFGGKWDRYAKGHRFESADGLSDHLAAVCATGTFVDPKKLFQFYETPDALAKLLVRLADIQPGDKVLEPSAGNGAIIRAIWDLHPQQVSVLAVDIDPVRLETLRDPRGINMSPDNTYCADFLTWKAPHLFDRIVMNPPFSKGREAEHVLHALDLLVPGGRLVSIMSAGIKFRETGAYDMVRALSDEIRDNPSGSFVVSGTNVETCTVIIDKPN